MGAKEVESDFRAPSPILLFSTPGGGHGHHLHGQAFSFDLSACRPRHVDRRARPSVCRAQTSVASARNNVSRAEQAERLVAEGVAAFDRGEMAAARDFFQKGAWVGLCERCRAYPPRDDRR